MCVGLCFCGFPFEILGSGGLVGCRILVSYSKAGVWFVRFAIICEIIVDLLAGCWTWAYMSDIDVRRSALEGLLVG
jgi:hypothetical protein